MARIVTPTLKKAPGIRFYRKILKIMWSLKMSKYFRRVEDIQAIYHKHMKEAAIICVDIRRINKSGTMCANRSRRRPLARFMTAFCHDNESRQQNLINAVVECEMPKTLMPSPVWKALKDDEYFILFSC